MWNPSTCTCECDKYCETGQYLDYGSCVCRNKLIDPFLEECTTIADIEVGNNNSSNAVTSTIVVVGRVYFVLFIMLLLVSVVTSGLFVYFYCCKKNNQLKKFIPMLVIWVLAI